MAITQSSALAALLALALVSTASAQTPATSGAAPANAGFISARLVTADGTDAGSVTFKSMRAGVLVAVDLIDLPPGPHAIHIHETGACTPDFDAAGEHLAPDDHEHGFAKTESPHAGDLPNLVADDDGIARAEFVNWRLTLDDLLDSDGSAVIVHQSADTYMDPLALVAASPAASSSSKVECGQARLPLRRGRLFVPGSGLTGRTFSSQPTRWKRRAAL